MTFATEIQKIHERMRQAPIVRVERWQGVDVSAKPDMQTHELRHVFLNVPMGTEELVYFQRQIKPNLPWADKHFDERVCGQPINPGIEWANWPYGHSADRFRNLINPVRSPSDWAYLAGLIDGDGSIGFRTANPERTKYARIKITQLDREYLSKVQSDFKVGTLREYSSPSNALSDKGSLIWRISAREEVRWVLTNTLPFLRLKKDTAQEALSSLPEGDGRHSGVSPLFCEPMFNHNYMERYWAAHFNSPLRGIRHPYGDLSDVVKQLVRDPTTRQAILPVFHPEDTGAVHGGRVPCSLAYQFFLRDGKLDVSYWLRSCDFLRHFRDDIYLTVRLCLWVLQEARKLRPEVFNDVRPGNYIMLITSLHYFRNDYRTLYGD